MTETRDRILGLLRKSKTLTATEISRTLHAHRDVIQTELHALDDAGTVLMRNGLYQIAEAARVEQEIAS